MKKLILTLFIGVLSINSYSQKLPFKYDSDSISLSKNISSLAKKTIRYYKEKDQKKYLDNLFRLQIVAKKYDSAIQTLNSLRVLYKSEYKSFHKVVGIQFETYSKIVTNKEYNKENIDLIFGKTLDKIYSKVSKNLKGDSFFYFSSKPKKEQKTFKKLIHTYSETDSISVKESLNICRNYLSLQVANLLSKSAKKYIKKATNERYIIQDSVFIKTRDKANLSAIIVRENSVKKPLPVILKFSIYPRSGLNMAKIAVQYGYVSVTVYTRGKRYSNDQLNPFEFDSNDTYDVIDWISKQPWCNGKIGMYGASYLGFTQWSATKNLHPALKTIVPMVSVGPGIDYPMYNNVFMSYMLRWIHYVENNKFVDSKEFRNTKKWDSIYNNWYKTGVAFNKLDSIDSRPNKTFRKWLKHPSYDKYWKNMMPYKRDFSKINIPVLTLTGYYDSDQRGALHYFEEHHKYNTNANHYLVIGPYDHSGATGFPDKNLNGYKIDSVADIRQIPLTFKWFNHILKDSLKPALLKDKINYQVMGTNTWKHKATIDKITNDSLTFYLDNTIVSNYYKLSHNKNTEEEEYIKQEIDFLDRTSFKKFQKLPEKIVDTVLLSKTKTTFISKAFQKDIEISGSFTGEINLIINKKDLDVSIELYQITPDGKFFALSTYLGRASYAKNRSKRKLLKPNKKESFPIVNASFTSKLLKKGSKLLVILSVNKSPYWQINYGTGKDVSKETIKDGTIPLQIKWLNSSYLKIPIYKR